MLWYFVFPIFITIIAIAGQRKPAAGLWVLFILLFFSVFRSNQVGLDTISYIENVRNGSFLFNNYSFEENIALGNRDILFYYVCFLIDKIGLSPRWILCYLALVTMVFLYMGAKRFRINIPIFLMFCVISTIYLHSLNIARQMAAVSVCFYATSFLQEKTKKSLLFWPWMLFAMLTHSSAFICLLLFPLKYISLNRKNAGVVLYCFSIIGIFVPMTSVFFRYFQYLSLFSSFNEGYGVASTDFEMGSGGVVGSLYKLMLFTIYYFVYRDISKEKKTNFIDNIFLLSIFFNALFAAETNIGTTRIRYYFFPFQCMYFTMYFFNNQIGKNKKVVLAGYYVIQYFLLISLSLGYEPYSMDFTL